MPEPTGNIIVSSGAGNFGNFQGIRIVFGDELSAEINDSIASFRSEHPLGFVLDNAGQNPGAFDINYYAGLIDNNDINGRNTSQPGATAAGDDKPADVFDPKRNGTFDCATKTCSDGLPPNWGVALPQGLNEWLACNGWWKKENVDKQLCGPKAQGTDGGVHGAENPLSMNNPLNGWNLDTSAAAILFIGAILVFFGIYAFIKTEG